MYGRPTEPGTKNWRRNWTCFRCCGTLTQTTGAPEMPIKWQKPLWIKRRRTVPFCCMTAIRAAWTRRLPLLIYWRREGLNLWRWRRYCLSNRSSKYELLDWVLSVILLYRKYLKIIKVRRIKMEWKTLLSSQTSGDKRRRIGRIQ